MHLPPRHKLIVCGLLSAISLPGIAAAQTPSATNATQSVPLSTNSAFEIYHTGPGSGRLVTHRLYVQAVLFTSQAPLVRTTKVSPPISMVK
jgi:hypothetical protein